MHEIDEEKEKDSAKKEILKQLAKKMKMLMLHGEVPADKEVGAEGLSEMVSEAAELPVEEECAPESEDPKSGMMDALKSFIEGGDEKPVAKGVTISFLKKGPVLPAKKVSLPPAYESKKPIPSKK